MLRLIIKAADREYTSVSPGLLSYMEGVTIDALLKHGIGQVIEMKHSPLLSNNYFTAHVDERYMMQVYKWYAETPARPFPQGSLLWFCTLSYRTESDRGI